MERTRLRCPGRGWLLLLLPLAVLLGSGCQTVKTPEEKIAKSNLPRELTKTSLPDYVVEPPDKIWVEVLEALPGRPITGERLVRPDGKISLDFYGDVYVRGLTTDQVKEKIIGHLRQFLPADYLGIWRYEATDEAAPPEGER